MMEKGIIVLSYRPKKSKMAGEDIVMSVEEICEDALCHYQRISEVAGEHNSLIPIALKRLKQIDS